MALRTRKREKFARSRVFFFVSRNFQQKSGKISEIDFESLRKPLASPQRKGNVVDVLWFLYREVLSRCSQAASQSKNDEDAQPVAGRLRLSCTAAVATEVAQCPARQAIRVDTRATSVGRHQSDQLRECTSRSSSSTSLRRLRRGSQQLPCQPTKTRIASHNDCYGTPW